MSQNPYRLVKQSESQLDQKIRKHRLNILKVVLLIVALILITAGTLYYIYQTRSYTDYEVLESVTREDSAGTRFVEFQGNIIKYSNDGAIYTDVENHLIWNQTYEMQTPILDVCGNYVAIAEQKVKKIYIMDTAGPCGEINTNRPILQVHVANQGMVAVLMRENATSYIQLYARDGSFLAEGELHAQNKGYPLDIDLSNDGLKFAVATQDVNEGIVRTTVAFYNFGSVGQNEIDNIVSSYPYSDILIPKIEFLTNDVAVAVGENRLIFYEGSQKPVVKSEIEIEREIRSIFYNDQYIGLVFDVENDESAYQIQVYNLNGTLEHSIDFSMEYEEIEFLNNDEICIHNDMECSIYNLRGVQRFHYNFEENIYKIIHTSRRQYLFLMDGSTERVVLR